MSEHDLEQAYRETVAAAPARRSWRSAFAFAAALALRALGGL